MKKSILFIVLGFALLFVCSCQKKEIGFSKSDFIGTWTFMMEEYTLNEDGTGRCYDALGEANLKWNVQNDSLFIVLVQGTDLRQHNYFIDSLIYGESEGKKIRTLYLSETVPVYKGYCNIDLDDKEFSELKKWLKTEAGRTWLAERRSGMGISWYGYRSNEWLWSESGQEWLQSEDGKEWLQTPEGKEAMRKEHRTLSLEQVLD